MTRKEAFQEITRAALALADLCNQQKDTVAWWTEFGTEFQKLGMATEVIRPTKDTLLRAAHAAMEKVRAPGD